MVDAKNVHEVLGRHQLADGLPLVVDMEGSHGSWLRDARFGEEYLDGYTCFASWPVGFGHPRLRDPEFERTLLRAARLNVSNSDLYTREYAEFVETFATRVTPEGFPHHFWVAGGGLAVENALKTAFDWKARKLGRTSMDADVNDLVVVHFREAFHGRTGYTMSLTNTVPDKIGLFPKFAWPRITNPKIEFDLDGEIANDVEAAERRAEEELARAFERHRGKVAAIVIEPMQGEGGDNHFRPELFHVLRRFADEGEALLVYDEVQTGFWGSGRPWMWQHHGVAPDVVAFGKKTQVCGIYASERVDEVEDNVFRRASRINSTWGGNLADMVRCRRFVEIIEEEGLPARVARVGERVVAGLRAIAREHGAMSNVRGIGSLVAFTLADAPARDRMLAALFERKVLALKSGGSSIRFRLPFVLTDEEADELLARVEAALPATRLGATAP